MGTAWLLITNLIRYIYIEYDYILISLISVQIIVYKSN